MSLREIPPQLILDRLAKDGVRPDDLLLSVPSDIDRYGRYLRQWLVVTKDRLFVLTETDPPQIAFSLDIRKATEYRVQSVIGSGLLQARVDDIFVDVLRFTNRHASEFEKVARKLDRYLQGDPIEIQPGEEEDPRRCSSCGLMLRFPGDICPRCVNRGAVLGRILGVFRPYWAVAALMMSLLLIGIALDLVSPRLTKFLIDNVLPGSVEEARRLQTDPSLGVEQLRLLLQVVMILALVQALRMVVNMVNGVSASRVGTAMTLDIRGRLVQHLEQLSVSYYDKQQVGSLVARVAYDTESLHGFVQQLTSGFVFQLLMIIGVGVMMFSLNVKLAIVALVPAPFVIAGSILFWKRIYPRYYRFWDASSKQAGMLAGMLSGIRVVKAFGQERREYHRFTQASNRLLRSRRGVDYSVAVFNPIMTLFFQFGGWIVWYWGGRDVLYGEMTLGTLMAFFGYLWMFYGPLATLTNFTNWLTQFVTQSHRIFEILDTPAEITDPKEPKPMGEVRGRIEFQHVTFGYDRHAPVIRDINLEIAPGEMVGIVGRSGSGKTTLINLLCRFYDVSEGRVLVDGTDVRQLQREDIRHHIGVVLQEPFLFRGSIAQNITYGQPAGEPEGIITAAKAGNAHDFILKTAHGYDTWVGERGAGLSGGERQRVGIARVLLTDPKILILDEATSSVDAESEAAIQAALAELVKGRTTIAIAHRLSTLRNANRILVVDGGNIAEEGRHDELMEKNGIYARLVRIQGQAAVQTVDGLAALEDQDDDTRLSDKGPLPDPRGFHPRWLTPENARIHLGNLGALHVTIPEEGFYGGIWALRCMPVHYPNQYISLRHLDHKKRELEVGLIRSLEEWPEDVQRLVNEALAKRYFVHTIESIDEIKARTGILEFKVQTDLGPMEFLLRYQMDRAQDYGTDGKILLDTEENRYLIPNLHKLSEKERRIFQRHIYW